MMYDPKQHGAKCDLCPLNVFEGPVPPETSREVKIVAVGEAPGEHEIREGRPFVGPSGNIITQTALRAGPKRSHVHWTNVCLCQPPENDMGRFLEMLRKSNRIIEKENRERKNPASHPNPDGVL